LEKQSEVSQYRPIGEAVGGGSIRFNGSIRSNGQIRSNGSLLYQPTALLESLRLQVH
jgi:hypothetical protein